jgi:hypothetical protein
MSSLNPIFMNPGTVELRSRRRYSRMAEPDRSDNKASSMQSITPKEIPYDTGTGDEPYLHVPAYIWGIVQKYQRDDSPELT